MKPFTKFYFGEAMQGKSSCGKSADNNLLKGITTNYNGRQ